MPDPNSTTPGRYYAHPHAPNSEPAVHLGEALAYMRASLGLPFEDAWRYGVEVILEPMKYQERESWRAVFDATRDAWQSAYEREHRTRGDRRISELRPPDD